MKKSTFISAISILAMSLIHPSTVNAEGVVVEATKITAELGVSVLQGKLDDADFTIPVSSLPSELRVEKLESSLSDYAGLRNSYTSAKSGIDGFASVTDAFIGASAATGNIYGVVIGGVLRAGVEMGNQSLNDYAEKKSREYLVGIADQLVSESGAGDFDSLVKNPKLIEDTLVNSSKFLSDVRIRAQSTNDPALLSTVAASIAQVADTKAVAAYRLAEDVAVDAAKQAEDIAQLDSKYSKFANTVHDEFVKANTRLDNHQRRLVGLETDVADLGAAVGEMQNQIGELGKNQDLIADFVFTRMTPSEKVHALKSGLLDKRIQCPVGKQSCNRNTVRAAMVARYSKEAKVQDTIKSIGGVVSNANTALKIANDLGLEVPKEISTAVSVATAGFNAFTSFTTGNYLGAISSITGLFGSKKDPAAERHKQMMALLKRNFKQINTKLDGLQKGQTRILEGLVQVSEQIHTLHVEMNARFRALDFRLDLIDKQLRQLIWKPWASCNTVDNYARFPSNDRRLSFVDRQTLFFKNFESRVATLNADEGAVRTCMRVMNDGLGAIISPDGWTRFGAIMDIERSLLNLTREQADRLEKAVQEEGAIDYRPLLPKYLDSIVKPSSHIVRDWANRKGIDNGTLLYLLAAAPQTIDELNSLLKVVFKDGGSNGWRFQCDSSDLRYPLIGGAVCRTNESEALIEAHLKSALDTDTLIEVSEWAMITSQVFDLYDGADDSFARNFSEVEGIEAGGAGQRLMRTLAALMALGVAYENRLHGGITAWIIADDIKTGVAKVAHQRILKANPYLAENVAMILLSATGKASDVRVSLENRHAQAMLHSRSGKAFPFGLFNALYGDDRLFRTDSYGRPALILNVSGGDVSLPLPGPSQLEGGRFIMPIEYESLTDARDRIVERVIDYDIGGDKDLVNTLVAVQ